MSNTNSDFRVYECLEDKFEELTKRVNSIARTIGRYGYKLEFKELGREMKTVPVYAINGSTKVEISEAEVKIVKYTFNMPDFKVGDYTPLALIEHGVVQESGNIVKNLVHWFDSRFYKEVPEDVRNQWDVCLGHCDDCNDKYLRQKTVMLRSNEDGSYRQIGMSCLKRYLGITAFNVIHNFMTCDELVEEDIRLDDDEFIGGGFQVYYLNTTRYIASVLRQIEVDSGYQSKCVISNKAFDFCFGIEADKNLKPYMAKAEAVKKFFQELDINKDVKDGFESDVTVAVRAEYTKASGLVAYAPVLMNKLVAAQEEKKRAEESGAHSQYIGSPGYWLNDIRVKVQNCVTIETQWGYSNLITFIQDGTDNQLVWFTSTSYYEPGTTCTIKKAKVKTHKEYKGIKQTHVNYVSCIDIVAPIK